MRVSDSSNQPIRQAVGQNNSHNYNYPKESEVFRRAELPVGGNQQAGLGNKNHQEGSDKELEPLVQNDVYNQIIEDVNKNPAKAKPEFSEGMNDFLKWGNLLRVFNTFCFLISFYFLLFDFENYAFCLASAVISYIFYWFDIFGWNSTFRTLRNIKIIHNVYEHVETVKRNGVPQIAFHMECYHWETRSRTVTETDSDGRTHSKTEFYEEKVVTWRGSEEFLYSSWSDESEDIHGMEDFLYTRVHFHKKYILDDEYTQREYRQQKQNFVNANVFRDSYNSCTEIFNISGHQEFVLSSLKPEVPWIMNSWIYLIICFFMLEIFYNLYMSCRTGKRQMTFIKRIRC